MLVRALKTFQGRYGKITKGQTFNADPGYVKQLNRSKSNPLVEVLEKEQTEPGPGSDRSKGTEAPQRGGKDNAPAGGQPPAATGAQSEGGRAITSASLPAVPASRKKTSKKSAPGGRRGVATPRKAKAKTASTPPADA